MSFYPRQLKLNDICIPQNTRSQFILWRTARVQKSSPHTALFRTALYHAFATFGSLMSPDLPLSRKQHEMITTLVSVTNRCHY